MFGFGGPQPSARGEWLKQSVSRLGGVGHNLPRSPLGPRSVQVLEGRQIAADYLLSSANDTLQSVTGGAAVGVQGEEQRGKDAALRRSGADGVLEIFI